MCAINTHVVQISVFILIFESSSVANSFVSFSVKNRENHLGTKIYHSGRRSGKKASYNEVCTKHHFQLVRVYEWIF